MAESRVVNRFAIRNKHPMPAPYVVKPVNEGSSFGVVIVKEDQSHPPQVLGSAEWRYGDTVMVERYVHGRELTCAVMGDVALGVTEIVPTGHAFYDYDSKYVPGGSKHECPQKFHRIFTKRYRHWRSRLIKPSAARGVSRSDFRYDDRHSENGELSLAGNQHPAGDDADVPCARDRPACGALLRRVVELDGGGRFVSALRPGQIKAQFASTGLAGTGLAGLRAAIDGFVLPRWLRWPVRVFGRMVGGHYEPPRFAATIASGAFLALSALYGAWLGGQMPSVVQSVTSRAGFAVDEVRVTGHRETSEIDILERLELDGWTSLVRASTPSLHASASRRCPGSSPLPSARSIRMRWRSTSSSASPSRCGSRAGSFPSSTAPARSCAPFGGGRHSMLPLVIGHGASERAAAFVDKVKQFPNWPPA